MKRPFSMLLALASHTTTQPFPSPPRLVLDLDSRLRASPSSLPTEFTNIAGMTYFAATDTEGIRGIYRSFGTAATTAQIASFRPGVTATPRYLRALGTRLFFVADDGQAGQEPWISDGTPEGTRMITDVTPGLLGTVVSGAHGANDRGIFFGGPITGDNEGFVTGCSEAGTFRLA